MARTYKRDSNGRFASTGGARSGRPAAKPVSRGKNRITRDNAGRITSVGGEGATARGGRLRTAAGNKRAVQTARIKGSGGKLRKPVGSGKAVPKGAPAQAGKSQGSSPRPSNKSPKGGNRWLSNEQVMQANEARGKEVRYTAAVMRSRLPKKEREASGVNTLGGYIAKYTGKPLSFAAANSVGDQIEKVTGIGRGQLKGVRKSIDNAKRTVTYSLTPVARKQAAIAEKVGSRKPRRRKPA